MVSLAKGMFEGLMPGGMPQMGPAPPPINTPPMAPQSPPMGVAPVAGTSPPGMPAPTGDPLMMALLATLQSPAPAPAPMPSPGLPAPGYMMGSNPGGGIPLSQEEYRQGQAQAYDRAKNSGIPERKAKKKKPATSNPNRQAADKAKAKPKDKPKD